MELNQYLKILWRRKLIIILTVAVTMAVVGIGTSMVTPLYRASTVLRIATSTSGQLSYAVSAYYTYSERLLNTYVEIVTSRPILTDLENKLAMTKAPVVKAEVLPNTELIKITVEHTDPQIAAKAANTLADILIEQSAPQYVGGKKSSQELLTEQFAQAKTDLDQAQQAYNTLQAQTLPISQQLDAAKQSLQLKQNNYASINIQYEQAILQSDAQAITASPAQKKILANQKEILAEQLAQAKADFNQAQQAYNTLQAQTLPSSQQIDAAKQLLQSKQDIYATLIQQYTQAILWGETQANMITVVETADIPQLPAQPSVLLNYALGLMIGLFGGLGLAFVFENLDTTLYTVEDIEAASKLPPMVNIPFATKKQLNISQNDATLLAEAFRNLATSVQMIKRQKTGKALIIMSAEPAQGKSMIVRNLAFSLAEFGESVAVIDCDMRLPNLYNLFGIPNERGLLDVLEGEASLNDVLQKSEHPNIQILTSGPNTTRSFQLLGSIQMAKLVADLKKQFDYVLLDSPALLAVSDVAALAKSVDGLIVVVRRGHAKREAIQKASKFLAGFPDKFVGLVVNQAENNHSFQFYQSHSKPGIQTSLPEHKILPVKEE